MKSLRFTATIQLRGSNPYILVSKSRAEQLKQGWRRPMPVLVQLNGKPAPPWKINMMPIGDGSFYLYLHNDVRKPTQTAVGDRAEVTLWFDESYIGGPRHKMHPYIKQALQQNKVAESNWKALPPSSKKEVLLYFSRLKSDKAKQDNTTRLLHVLSGNKERFLAREWRGGR